MRVSELFGQGLTIPQHENNDLHYIGEALPAPSQITSTLSTGTPAYVGGSPIPAREDHIHALDLQDLIDAINENPDIDLSNYYTKAEVDALLAAIIDGSVDLTNYYTIAEIDALFAALISAIDSDFTDVYNYIDAQIAAIDAVVVPIELYWSYGEIVAPSASVFTNRYECFRTFEIVEISLTLITASAEDYIVNLWHDSGGGFTNIETTILTASSLTTVNIVGTPITINNGDFLYFEIEAEPAGDGVVLTIGIRGNYV